MTVGAGRPPCGAATGFRGGGGGVRQALSAGFGLPAGVERLPVKHRKVKHDDTMSSNDWKRRSGVVYSTDPAYSYAAAGDPDRPATLAPAKQQLRVALDRRHRGGKQVTVVADFVGSDDDLKELGKLLKQRCGVGGTAKDGEILIQGDFRDKIVRILVEAGYKARKI